jgi:hypothetical protein
MDLTSKIGVVFAVSGGAWAMFKALEETSSATARATLSAWLKQTPLSLDRTPTIHRVLHQTFESFFGRRIFSRKFVLRSVALSAVGIFVAYIIGIPFLLYVISLFMPDEMTQLLGELRGEIAKELSKSNALDIAAEVVKSMLKLTSYFLAVVAACCFIDYLSLCKTWLIVRNAKQTGQWKRAYLLDFCLTFLMSLGWAVFWGVSSSLYKKIFGVEKLEYNFIPYVTNGLISAWIPTYILASFVALSFLAKIAARIMIPAEFLKSRLLAIDEKPFQSVGVIAALVLLPITTVYVAVVA